MKVDLEELEDKLDTAFNIVSKAMGIVVLPCVEPSQYCFASVWCTWLLSKEKE